MRVPKVHVPYLFGVGLFGLAQAASPHLLAPSPAMTVVYSIMIAAAALNVVWLQTLYRDAQVCLGDTVPMPAQRVALVTLISCPVMMIWTGFAFMVLLRSAVNSYGDQADRAPPFLLRAAQNAPALILAAVFWMGVEAVSFIQLEQAGVVGPTEVGPYRVADVLGQNAAYVISGFHVAVVGYWLWFVARSVPPLYRSLERKDDPAMERSSVE